MKEIAPNTIKNKLSGKFDHLYPVYEKLRDELAKNIQDVKFILKTIYIKIDSKQGLLGVIFWKENGLHVAIPKKMEHDRIINGTDLKYKGYDKKIILKKVEDVDKFVLTLFVEKNPKKSDQNLIY